MNTNSDKGRFIVIEGCNGCGKSLLVNKLKKELEKNKNIIFVKEPNFTKLGNEISKIIETNDLGADVKMHLYTAERLDLVNNIILPALNSGKTIVCERYALSTWAYQCSEDNTLLPVMKSILEDLSSKCNVDETIYLNTTASDIKDKNEGDIVKLGHLLLWYGVGLLGQEFPKKLLGHVTNIDVKLDIKEKINLIKNIILHGSHSNCGLASGEDAV